MARLTALPRAAAAEPAETGVHTLPEDAVLHVPRSYRPEHPAPLALLLHGAGAPARGALDLLLPLADDFGLVLLAPQSRSSTWDVIVGGFGPDVQRIDRALAEAFGRCAVDRERVAIGGFSDGASYALSLGLANGDLFRAILAFSPGFSAAPERRGSPRIFVSHGTEDTVLPIDSTSRRVVPKLRAEGYEVRYREFREAHTVPAPIAREAVEWGLA